MPRKARIDTPGTLHHVIVRGIERGKIFRSDYDRGNYLNRLSELMPETRTDCFAWSLIPNHFHFLLRTGAVPIEVLMNRLLTGYSGWLNKKYKRNGQLFQNRYKSFLCQEDLYLKAGGYDFDCAVQRVAQVLNIRPDEVTAYGK